MRTFCWPLQMVQYFSQEQCSSVLSHIMQMTGPGMGASRGKLYLTMATRGKARVFWMRRVAYSVVRGPLLSRWRFFSSQSIVFRLPQGFFDAFRGAC
jgi:hypothetical protein